MRRMLFMISLPTAFVPTVGAQSLSALGARDAFLPAPLVSFPLISSIRRARPGAVAIGAVGDVYTQTLTVRGYATAVVLQRTVGQDSFRGFVTYVSGGCPRCVDWALATVEFRFSPAAWMPLDMLGTLGRSPGKLDAAASSLGIARSASFVGARGGFGLTMGVVAAGVSDSHERQSAIRPSASVDASWRVPFLVFSLSSQGAFVPHTYPSVALTLSVVPRERR